MACRSRRQAAPRAAPWLAALWLLAPLVAAAQGVPAAPVLAPVPALAASAAAPLPALGRPRIGLVLSGGGARGLAHVGVLKVLEQLQIPIDVITGTSMGAIVGGLYASGMRADALERELQAVQWSEVFTTRVPRQQLSQRRKEEDFEISPLVELGWRNGELQVPLSAVSSRGLESLLRRYTLPVRDVQRFDQLPIPFRAVATDMESGAAVVLDRGDLALALRSSMSVPGVFSPTEVDGRVLGDGGLVNNLPIDVARAMGADVVIAVNIGTPPGGRETLNSAVGLTAQMLNLLTEQNVQRSLATLRPDDVLIAPALGQLSSGDFDRGTTFFSLGEAGARGRSDRLAPLALAADDYARWRAGHPRPADADARLAGVRIQGSTVTNADRLLPMLESKPGQPFDAARAERDTARLAAGGDYTRTDYLLVPGARPQDGDTLVFDLEDKPWGPNYLTLGLDLSTDLSGRSAFNLKISHNSHWLTPSGTEWRNRVQIGEVPRVFTELYHPLAWTDSRANDWFVAGYASLERRRMMLFRAETAQELATFRRTSTAVGLDIGQPWGEFGELRLGWSRLELDNRLLLLSGDLGLVAGSTRAVWTENALRARAVVDQLDYANFPQSGYRGALEFWLGRRTGALRDSFHRLEAEGTVARSVGRHTLELHLLAQTSQQSNISSGAARYSLGGFHRLSGYQNGQLVGNHVLLLRMGWMHRLSQAPTLTRGFFVGATLEAGNTWQNRGDIALSNLRTGMSLYLGADTGIGPLYVGITHAPKGQTGLALSIGRP